uniref:Uncharacterized protein n=1 Tax=Avena sativa TaxID=4498 RepID=A0ACD6AMV4_AVESA
MAMGVQQIKYFSQAKLGRRWRRPVRGFRMTPARLSVRRLRARLWTMLGLLGRYFRNVRLPLLTRGLVAASGSSPASSVSARGGGGRTALAGGGAGRAAGKPVPAAAAQAAGGGASGKPRRPPCMRSNSFYARAVADCLDFIKGSNAAAPTVEDSRGGAGAGVRRADGQHQAVKGT